ncbi:MAG: uroporphyrinogen decarboxylase [Candidatus Dormibacteria bacterium]
MTGAERFLAAARRQSTDCTPVWFMRQAGRVLAGYRELRERYDILTLTRTPDLCAQVTLMPVRELGVDAAVMYADIMLPLIGMGVPFSIDPGIGPIIHAPVRDAAAVDALRVADPLEATPDLFEAIRIVRRELDGGTAVIGFAGGPFTVASYMLEGRPSKDFAHTKALLYGDNALWHRLMETLTDVTIKYLAAQIDAGAQAVQLFDSWAGALAVSAYEDHVLPYTRRVFDSLRDRVPTIHFATVTAHLLEVLAGGGSAIVSVDWRLPLDAAWERIGTDRGIQGNLEPAAAAAPFAVTAREARDVLARAAGRPGHIFNLGHGVLPQTPTDNLRRLVDLVHAETAVT